MSSDSHHDISLPPAQPLLPRRGRGDRPLLMIIAVMAFLAGLALLTAIWASRAGEIWTSGLDGQMTVQVMDAEQAGAAVALIDALPRISAERLSDDAIDALLAPWLGTAELPDDIPVPAMIRVDGTIMADELADRLAGAGIEADVDDHQRWADRVRRAALWSRLSALAVLAMILAAGAATSSFATEAAMRSEEVVIRVLGQVGAQDRFVARLFIERFFFAGLKAGVAGGLGALLFGAVMGLAFGAPFGSGGSAVFWMVMLSFLFGIISAVSAGRMALSRLQIERAAR